MNREDAVKAMVITGGLLVVLGLFGCSSIPAIKAPIYKGPVNYFTLPKFAEVTDNATHNVLCPFCLQSNIAPTWCQTPKAANLMYWTCGHCRGQWLTLVASESQETINVPLPINPAASGTTFLLSVPVKKSVR